MNKISVIIPSFNGEAFIEDAIQSINKQTLAAHEIIVVDDGSTDGTEEIVRQQPGNIRFFKQANTGKPAAGRNRGIKEATGEYIALLDQDDTWPANKLEIQLSNFRKIPCLHIDVGFSKIINSDVRANNSNQQPDDELIRQFLLSAMLIRKSAFDLTGLFDETMQYYGSDLDWIFRARETGLLFNIHDELTLYYHLHTDNHSKNIELFRMARIEVIKKSLLRRKLANAKAFKATPGFNTLTEK